MLRIFVLAALLLSACQTSTLKSGGRKNDPSEPAAEPKASQKRPDLAGLDQELNLTVLDGPVARNVTVSAQAPVGGLAARVIGRSYYATTLQADGEQRKIRLYRVSDGVVTVLGEASAEAGAGLLQLATYEKTLRVLFRNQVRLTAEDDALNAPGRQGVLGAVVPDPSQVLVYNADEAPAPPKEVRVTVGSASLVWALTSIDDAGLAHYGVSVDADCKIDWLQSGATVAMQTKGCEPRPDCHYFGTLAGQTLDGTVYCSDGLPTAAFSAVLVP